jgi:GTPase SAR1 family protein
MMVLLRFVNINICITQWVPEITHHCPNTPFLLVGNKLDLREDPATLERLAEQKQGPVSTLELHKMAEEVGALTYCETYVAYYTVYL